MKKIGIIGAMELEVAELKEAMNITSTKQKANMEFFEGTIKDTNVVVVRCGIGKVNAALCVQILVDLFQVSHIINTGIAGSLNAKLDIGDMVISSDVIHHDMDATVFGYPLGEVPQLGVREFIANDSLVALALETNQIINPQLNTLKGRIISGDQFISSKEVKEKLISNFSADCTEMEGAAIAHGAFLNDVPFVIIRAISDKADDSAEMDYPTFEKAAASHCAHLVEALVSKI